MNILNGYLEQSEAISQEIEDLLIRIEGGEEIVKKLKEEDLNELIRKLVTLHKFCKAKNLLISQSSLKYDKEN